MKKKIVKFMLSAVVAASLMLSVTACGSKSIGEWVTSKEAATYTEQLNTLADGMMTTSFEADGDVLLMIFTYSDDMIGMEASALTDEQKDALKATMQQNADEQAGSQDMKEAREEIIKMTGISDLKIRAVYKLSDGTEMCTMDL